MKNWLQLICVCTPGSIGLICFMTLLMCGCTNSPAERLAEVEKSFTNQTAVAKATTYDSQFVVRCADGSIWEVLTRDSDFKPKIFYKNCLFDPVYSLPTPPPKPLEKSIE